jgi:flagellar motor switch protein FliN/FliY
MRENEMSNVVNNIEFPELAGGGDRTPALGERLDLIGHVKVKLTVALGAAEVTIGKLFSLSPNDVVTLDRSVEAPVDIRLNEKIVARGTLVAVGDNFGVRVTDISRE